MIVDAKVKLIKNLIADLNAPKYQYIKYKILENAVTVSINKDGLIIQGAVNENFKVEDDKHWSFLIDDNINKAVEI